MELRPLEPRDAADLRRILLEPAVARWWGTLEDDFPLGDEPEATRFVIDVDGAVAGMVQYGEELDPLYRSANIDIFLASEFHGRGIGAEAVRRVVRLLIERGHHRITIDPAAENVGAIRSYEKVGFKPVGIMRRYERDTSGDGWHDALLMDLLAGEET